MNAYAQPTTLAELQTLTSEDIDVLFKRSAGWFSHSRVRNDLYARGFPEPIAAGRWSAVQVKDWMANPKPKPAKRRQRRRNGYARP